MIRKAVQFMINVRKQISENHLRKTEYFLLLALMAFTIPKLEMFPVAEITEKSDKSVKICLLSIAKTKIVGPERFELSTFRLSVGRSSQSKLCSQTNP